MVISLLPLFHRTQQQQHIACLKEKELTGLPGILLQHLGRKEIRRKKLSA